jgi:hypothetical protein
MFLKCSLALDLNSFSEVIALIEGGKLFQSLPPVKATVLAPKVLEMEWRWKSCFERVL